MNKDINTNELLSELLENGFFNNTNDEEKISFISKCSYSVHETLIKELNNIDIIYKDAEPATNTKYMSKVAIDYIKESISYIEKIIQYLKEIKFIDNKEDDITPKHLYIEFNKTMQKINEYKLMIDKIKSEYLQ